MHELFKLNHIDYSNFISKKHFQKPADTHIATHC